MRAWVVSLLFVGLSAGAVPLPTAPTDASHPGSKVYSYTMTQTTVSCLGRNVLVYKPQATGEKFPVVVYGHGQALNESHYLATFEHLAKKGVGVIYPLYDNGFFDQDWPRMARDYVSMTECALQANTDLDPERVVYSGHSKGAYVAGFAAGVAADMAGMAQPRAVVLFAPAGADSGALSKYATDIGLTVVYSDSDSMVPRSHSEKIFTEATCTRKQLITVKSYTNTEPRVSADHFWPLTKPSMFGGGSEGPLHYYGSWKWLVAAAQDLGGQNKFTNRYLYGDQTADKGVSGLEDDVQR